MIEFTKHAEKKLKERGITKSEVTDVITNPDEVLFDTVKGNLVAIRKINDYYLIVIYTPTRPLRALVTSKLNIVENRVKRGRWVRLRKFDTIPKQISSTYS